MNNRLVLIIGRPGRLSAALADNLRQSGCEVRTAVDSEDGLEQAITHSPDIVLVGHHSPESFDMCRRISSRMRPEQLPAFLVTPGVGQTDGVDEEPQSIDSLLAETLALDLLAQGLKTLLSRARQAGQDDVILEHHGLRLDRTRYTAELKGVSIGATPTEFRLLWRLMAKPGHVFSRHDLFDACRTEQEGEPSSQSRAIDVHIKTIRRKLAEQANLIETIRGVGYRFREPVWGVAPFE
ncbi:response regulator transcription factor [Blastopirellula marina]|uniref:Phosphate regulon response regulator PhoB n=1 Tax=Blastopirellula marina DSM 3645 TaxID=314230 RepID=A3ZZ52_9BACT|nr:response regulator transcription factor [Blastopirellula marina]EAQ78218.1 phosphate regulon response regulator PhoB [Blastopirellula marina DSM 3645]